MSEGFGEMEGALEDEEAAPSSRPRLAAPLPLLPDWIKASSVATDLAAVEDLSASFMASLNLPFGFLDLSAVTASSRMKIVRPAGKERGRGL